MRAVFGGASRRFSYHASDNPAGRKTSVRPSEPTSGEILYPFGAAARLALLYRRNIKPAGFRRLGAALRNTRQPNCQGTCSKHHGCHEQELSPKIQPRTDDMKSHDSRDPLRPRFKPFVPSNPKPKSPSRNVRTDCARARCEWQTQVLFCEPRQ